MTSKNLSLILLTACLGGVWLYLHRDWFQSDRIQIHTRLVPPSMVRMQRRLSPAIAKSGAEAAAPVMFEWDRKVRLTAVSVYPLAAIETNKYATEVWHLVSDSNSPPTRGLIYGENVPGMRAATKGLDPEPLVPGEKYRLVLKVGSVKMEHDFVAEGKTE